MFNRGSMLAAALGFLFGSGSFGAERTRDPSKPELVGGARIGFRQRNAHGKRSVSAAKAKRAAKKRRNARARAAK